MRFFDKRGRTSKAGEWFMELDQHDKKKLICLMFSLTDHAEIISPEAPLFKRLRDLLDIDYHNTKET